MTKIDLFDAKNRLYELIYRLQQGEVFTITRWGRAVARLALPGDAEAGERAVVALRARRQGVSLSGLGSRSLIDEGRR